MTTKTTNTPRMDNIIRMDTDSVPIGIDNRCSLCISHVPEDFMGNLIPSNRKIKGFRGIYHQEFKWAPSSGYVMMIRVKNTNSSSLTHFIFHQENADSSVHNAGHKQDREIRNMQRRSQMLKMSPSHGEDHLTNSPRPLESKTTLAHYI